MPIYPLYVESGPRKKKTQVHVIGLLGCIANGSTTDQALEATPNAIRDYLRFLDRHGARADPNSTIATKITAHVTEGTWLGQGDPDPGFPPDFKLLTPADHHTYIERLDWMRADFLDLLRSRSPEQLDAAPKAGRPARRIACHVAGAHRAYMQTPVQRPKESAAAFRVVEDSPDLVAALESFFALHVTRLESITPEERKAHVPHGVKTWTARRMFRRMLEHQWEHLQELRVRSSTS